MSGEGETSTSQTKQSDLSKDTKGLVWAKVLLGGGGVASLVGACIAGLVFFYGPDEREMTPIASCKIASELVRKDEPFKELPPEEALEAEREVNRT